MTTYDVSIVLTITADSQEEAAEKVHELIGIREDDLPAWSAMIIKELKA